MPKIALITGGNRGLGFATARTLARTGVMTIIAARDGTEAEQAASELRSEGLEAGSVTLDVDAPASVRAAAEQVQRSTAPSTSSSTTPASCPRPPPRATDR